MECLEKNIELALLSNASLPQTIKLLKLAITKPQAQHVVSGEKEAAMENFMCC